MRLALRILTCFALITVLASTARALILVDFRPQAVVANGGTLGGNFYANTLGNQILADKFTWAGGELTGASIFSQTGLGSVGDAARIIGHSELGADKTPVIDISTTNDVVDQLYSNSSSTRKHASFALVSLAAGDCYLSMTGALRRINIDQGTATDDDLVYTDRTANPDITDLDGFAVGDLLFQPESNFSAAPEPATWLLWAAFGAIGVVESRQLR